MLEFTLFGGLGVAMDGVPAKIAIPRRGVALLSYILLQGSARLNRERVATILWPDETEADGRAKLRRMLYLIAQGAPLAKSPEWLAIDAATVMWNPALPRTLDVEHFRNAVAAEEPIDTTRIYRGDLLPEIEDEWILPERERLRDAHLGNLERVAKSLADAKRFAEARAAILEVLRLEPWREDAMRLAIELRVATGDRAGALTEFDRFQERLRDELGVDPMPETLALRATLLAEPSAPMDARRIVGGREHNLPLQLTTCIGRAVETREIMEGLESNRLVTVTGSGGIGKTRVSLEVAAKVLDGTGDGVWFIELAPLSDGGLIPSKIAETLALKLPPDGDPLEHLTHALEATRALLIFDNCEHLIESAARFVATIVKACPHIAILASSRQPLGIAGEVTYRLSSLETPSDLRGSPLSAAEAAGFAAVQLFAERARAAHRTFEVTDENAPIIADICRRLDGIALAIELAAARVKVLSPRQLRDRLDDRFRVLTSGGRDRLPRQQTLRALIDWSYDLLDERERILFRRLGIFIDGFTLERARAVTSGDDLDDLDVFDLVASLVEKSLVLAEPDGDAWHYRLLETTRAYALEKLREAGERDRIAARNLRDLRDRFAAIALRQETTARFAELAGAFESEIDGVRFALDDALARGESITGAQLLRAISRQWMRYYRTEGIARTEAFIAVLPEGESSLLADLWSHIAYFLAPGMRCFAAAEQALAHARLSGDTRALANALYAYADANLKLEQFVAATEALNEADALPNLSALSRELLSDTRRRLNYQNGDLDAVVRECEANIARQKALGNIGSVCASVVVLAEAEHARGHTSRSIALMREWLPATETETLLACGRANLAAYLLARNELPEAVSVAREAIETLPRDPAHLFVASAIEHIALALALHGRFARAARLEAYFESALSEMRVKRGFTEQATHDRLSALLAANLTKEQRTLLDAEGASLTAEAAVALALVPVEDPKTDLRPVHDISDI